MLNATYQILTHVYDEYVTNREYRLEFALNTEHNMINALSQPFLRYQHTLEGLFTHVIDTRTFTIYVHRSSGVSHNQLHIIQHDVNIQCTMLIYVRMYTVTLQ